MSLEKTVLFRFKDVMVEFKPELYNFNGQCDPGVWPFCTLPVKLTFPSGTQREGHLRYDLCKRVFLDALTDLWEYRVDWNDPKCDMEMVLRCDTYRLELSRAIDALLQLHVIKFKPYS